MSKDFAQAFSKGLPGFLVLGFLLSCGVAYSDVSLSGSSYNETSLVNDDGTIRYGNRSDLHLKFVSRSEGAKMVAEMDFYMLYGYLASTAAQLDSLQLALVSPQLVSEYVKDGLFYVDRLYFKFPIRKADVILGKQRIAWGSGVVYRPTDTFNRPNPLSLSGRKEGVNALTARVFLGPLSALDFVVAPADVFRRIDGEVNLERLKYSKFGSRFTFNKFKSDVAFSYQYNGEPGDHILGLDLKGDLKLGYHLEAAFAYNGDTFSGENLDEYWRSVLGLDYSFGGGKWFLLGEYLYNGPGRTEEMPLPASSFSLVDEFQYRHYLYTRVIYQPDIFLSGNAFILWNIVDSSFILSPGVRYSLFQNMDLDIYSLVFVGDGEYGPDRLGVDQVYYVKFTVKF